MSDNGIHERITLRLAELDRKAAWLARESGVSYEKIRNLGRREGATLSAIDADKVAATLGVSSKWLIHGDERSEALIKLRRQVDSELDRLSEAELRGLLTGLRTPGA